MMNMSNYKAVIKTLRNNTHMMDVKVKVNTCWYKKVDHAHMAKVMVHDMCEHNTDKVTIYAIPKNKVVGVFVPPTMLVSNEFICHITDACKGNTMILL